MNDEQFFLANAYLDDELTDAERAAAEADPEVMAEVDELRALQALMRDVEPPSEATQEAAIAAAMSHFGVVAPPATSQRVAPHRTRPSYSRYLAVAAGVLGVGLLGVAVANLGTGDDDDSASDEPAAEEPAAESRLTEDEPFAAESADDMATAEVPAEEPAEEPAMDAAEEAADEPASEPAEEPAEEPADGGAGAERPELTPDQVLTTPEEVGSFGTGLLEQQLDGTLPPTPNHSCPIDNVLGRADYRPADAVDAATTLLIAVDEPAEIVLGFDDESCELVVEGPLYLP